MKQSDELIDVRQLLAASSIEEHCRLAENYFARLNDWTHHLAKPFGSVEETPQLLINFAMVLQGAQLCPGMTVLEFGAGTCWAARMLTQLGCKVIACDVSASALQIGRELYHRNPPAGDLPPPHFLLFDGHRIDLGDASVDRIICLDAFHHVPNPSEVLLELGRVLTQGGIAAFAEPGPEHSKTVQSQYEMRTSGVIENDIRIEEIWHMAQQAGFTDLKLAVFLLEPRFLALSEFEEFLRGKGHGIDELTKATREFMQNQRNFFLYKGPPAPRDSRYRHGLTGQISLSPATITLREGELIKLKAVVTNDSKSVWLPVSAEAGGVMLGCHVHYSDRSVFHESYQWIALTSGEGRKIFPGETVAVEVELSPLPCGTYILEFDLVSNNICWFSINGSEVVRVGAEVLP
ncbi:MAG: class I SAM-dependent methyltransferase [bacterium]